MLGFGKGDHVEGKLVTVVHGNDLVNTSFLNFQAMQEDTAKVILRMCADYSIYDVDIETCVCFGGL